MKIEKTKILEQWISKRFKESYYLVHGVEISKEELDESLDFFFSSEHDYIDYQETESTVKYLIFAHSSEDYSKPFYDVDIRTFYYSQTISNPAEFINNQIIKIKSFFKTDRISCLFLRNFDHHIISEFSKTNYQRKNIYFRGKCSLVRKTYAETLGPLFFKLKLDQYQVSEYSPDQFNLLNDMVGIDMKEGNGYFGNDTYEKKDEEYKENQWKDYSEKGRGILIKKNNLLVGALLLSINPGGKYSSCAIADLFIKNEYRKKGVLNLFFHELVQTAVGHDVQYIGGGTQNPMVLRLLDKLNIPLVTTLYHVR